MVNESLYAIRVDDKLTLQAHYTRPPPHTHHAECASSSRSAACRAACGVANSPKHVAPDPLIRAIRQPSCPPISARTWPTGGQTAQAASSRLFPCCLRKATTSAISAQLSGKGARGRKAPSGGGTPREWKQPARNLPEPSRIRVGGRRGSGFPLFLPSALSG